MQLQPLLQRDLHTRQLRHCGAFHRTDDRLAVCLPPPAARRPIFEHGVEVVHADKAERLRQTVHGRTEHATGAADRAVADENRPARQRVAHLMVIADVLQRIRAGLTVHLDSDDESVRRHCVRRRRLKIEHGRLQEHVISRHPEVERVGQRTERNDRRRHQPPHARRAAPRRHRTGQGHHTEQRAHRPTPRVQRIRQAYAAHPLTARHRHDEIHQRNLQHSQTEHTDPEQTFHRTSPMRAKASATPFVHPKPSCVGYSPPPAGRLRSSTSYFSVILPTAA